MQVTDTLVEYWLIVTFVQTSRRSVEGSTDAGPGRGP